MQANQDSLEMICGDNKATYTGKGDSVTVTIRNINMVFKLMVMFGRET